MLQLCHTHVSRCRVIPHIPHIPHIPSVSRLFVWSHAPPHSCNCTVAQWKFIHSQQTRFTRFWNELYKEYNSNSTQQMTCNERECRIVRRGWNWSPNQMRPPQLPTLNGIKRIMCKQIPRCGPHNLHNRITKVPKYSVHSSVLDR